MNVVELHDAESIAAALERDRVWAAYVLADLDDPYRQHSRFFGALSGEEIAAVLLVYAPPEFRVLIPSGAAGGVREIFEQDIDLPFSALAMAREEDVSAITRRYELIEPVRMFRMFLAEKASLAPPAAPGATLLHPADLDALVHLYADWMDARPAARMIEDAIVYGVFEGDDLVAAAGSHAASIRFSCAAIGGVFTHPDFRGRGLAKRVTSAVSRHLQDLGIKTIVLNVRADNAPAIAAYRAVGFEIDHTFLEAELRLHPAADGTQSDPP